MIQSAVKFSMAVLSIRETSLSVLSIQYSLYIEAELTPPRTQYSTREHVSGWVLLTYLSR